MLEKLTSGTTYTNDPLASIKDKNNELMDISVFATKAHLAKAVKQFKT